MNFTIIRSAENHVLRIGIKNEKDGIWVILQKIREADPNSGNGEKWIRKEIRMTVDEFNTIHSTIKVLAGKL